MPHQVLLPHALSTLAPTPSLHWIHHICLLVYFLEGLCTRASYSKIKRGVKCWFLLLLKSLFPGFCRCSAWSWWTADLLEVQCTLRPVCKPHKTPKAPRTSVLCAFKCWLGIFLKISPGPRWFPEISSQRILQIKGFSSIIKSYHLLSL